MGCDATLLVPAERKRQAHSAALCLLHWLGASPGAQLMHKWEAHACIYCACALRIWSLRIAHQLEKVEAGAERQA